MSDTKPNQKPKSFLEILKSRLLRKSEDVETETPPAEAVNEDAVITEIVGKFNDGSLEPDVEDVKAYIVEKGIEDAKAEELATNIIDSYFSESEGGETETPKGGETETPKEGEMMDEKTKSTMNFVKSQEKNFMKYQENFEIIAKSNLEILNRLSHINSRLNRLENSLAEASGKPVNQKQPVLTKSTSTKQFQDNSEYDLNCELLLKGVMAGKFTTEHLALYEGKRLLTKEAQSYLNTLKLEGK